VTFPGLAEVSHLRSGQDLEMKKTSALKFILRTTTVLQAQRLTQMTHRRGQRCVCCPSPRFPSSLVCVHFAPLAGDECSISWCAWIKHSLGLQWPFLSPSTPVRAALCRITAGLWEPRRPIHSSAIPSIPMWQNHLASSPLLSRRDP
jgi:hypothetical protein